MKKLMIFFLILATSSSALQAHHFKGLPHYGYFDNYPQVPTDEFLAQKGRFEYSLVIYDFQGLKQEDMESPNDARFFLVIYDLIRNEAYRGKIQMDLMDGNDLIESIHRKEAVQECIYQFSRTLGATGNYSLHVTLVDEGGTVTEIPFTLSSQKVNWAIWIGASLALLVVVAAVGARKKRVQMDRRQNIQTKKPQEKKSLRGNSSHVE